MDEMSATHRSPNFKSENRQTNWRRANPDKYSAHLAVQQAITAGVLTKSACEVCGTERVDAHHDRYDEPLKVRWLCRRHHVKLHFYGEDMFPMKMRECETETSRLVPDDTNI